MRMISGDGHRETRLHTMQKKLVVRGLIDLPQVLGEAAIRRASGRLPAKPWLPYPVIRYLDRRRWGSVLEFGSGRSTAWLAGRSRQVTSIESDREWFQRVDAELRSRHIQNVELLLRVRDEYCSDPGSGPFDLILIDGILRDKCARVAGSLIAPGGVVILDNHDSSAISAEHADAAAILTSIAGGGDRAIVRRLRGFAPATLVASESLVVEFR